MLVDHKRKTRQQIVQDLELSQLSGGPLGKHLGLGFGLGLEGVVI